MQKAAISASECIRTGQNDWSPGSRFVYRDIAARTGHAATTVKLWLCVYGTTEEKGIPRRDEQVLDHVM